MTGRVVPGPFRGASREVIYRTYGAGPEGLLWWFVDYPHHERVTKVEQSDIEARCLADLRERRAEWRAQLLTRRIAPEQRRKRL